MDGNVRCFTISAVTFTLAPLPDVILAAADVEGNFLVVKVRLSSSALRVNRLNLTQAYTYTDLLSCLLLDAYVTWPWDTSSMS